MDMCVRGFSFMPEDNAANELKYIEGEELERTWKSTRRLRVKKREEKIWDEFVKEQDIVHSVCEDDPYQFLEELPEECLKELMKSELQKMKNEQLLEELEAFQSDDAQQYMVEDDVRAPQHVEEVHHISYNEDDEGDDGVFHIFDSEKDDISGQEDNQIDSTGSPCTVRENKDDAQSSTDSPELRLSGRKEKPAENVAHVIESSIYCAKVKDLRTKLCEELSSIVTTLENQDLSSIEGNELARMCKRSNEFCIRFNRIHMYQLQRQLQDLKRHTKSALPFAKHTQFQSLMVRVVSLHQNMLQAYQVFNKSIEQTACLRESSTALAALIQATRQASDLCKSAPAPKDFAAITDLYNDELLVSCQELEASMHVYNSKVTEYMQDNDTNSIATSRKSNRKCFGKKSGVRTWSKSGPRSGTEERLSMYSLDTIRHNLNAKSSSSRENQSRGTSKVHISSNNVDGKETNHKSEGANKTNRKSPRFRRPLMRDPHQGRPRSHKHQKDTDIQTMVEAVEPCASSHISREASPQTTPQGRSNETTPRLKERTCRNPSKDQQRKSQPPTPRSKVLPQSPQLKDNSGIRKAVNSNSKTARNSTQTQETARNEIENIPRLNLKSGRDLNKDDGNDTAGIDDKSPKVKTGKEVEKNGAGEDLILKEQRAKAGSKVPNSIPTGCEVTRLLKQLCSGDKAGGRHERVSGTKNAQLVCVSGGSPRQPNTPQLLKILEETIQKKTPRSLCQRPSPKDVDRFRLTFNIDEQTSNNLFQYRTKFVQHMLTSPMYANSTIGKPWETIGSISEKIIDELLLNCAKEMEIRNFVDEIYKFETS